MYVNSNRWQPYVSYGDGRGEKGLALKGDLVAALTFDNEMLK